MSEWSARRAKSRAWITASLCFVTTSVSPGFAAERPPPLTFDKPVDYVAWYRNRVAKAGQRNAYEVLAKLYTPDHEELGFPGPLAGDDDVWKPLGDIRSGGFIWTAGEFTKLDKYLRSHDKHLRTFEESTKLPSFWRVIPESSSYLFAIPSPAHTAIRLARDALIARAWKRQDNQAMVLTDAHCTCARNILQRRQDADLINLICMSNDMSALCSSIGAALQQNLLDAESMRRTRESLIAWAERPTQLDEVYYREWAVSLDQIQYLFPGGQRSQSRFDEVRAKFGQMMLPDDDADPHKLVNTIEKTCKGLAQIAREPLSRKTWKKMERHLTDVFKVTEPQFKFPEVDAALARSYLLWLRADTSWRATILALYLHEFHSKQHRWPSKLAELSLTDARFRIDPFSGKDFVYRVERGDPCLYSVADDGEDNGGKHASNWSGYDESGDFVFLPYQEPHRMYVKRPN